MRRLPHAEIVRRKERGRRTGDPNQRSSTTDVRDGSNRDFGSSVLCLLPPASDISSHELTTELCQSTKSLRDSGTVWRSLSVIPWTGIADHERGALCPRVELPLKRTVCSPHHRIMATCKTDLEITLRKMRADYSYVRKNQNEEIRACETTITT